MSVICGNKLKDFVQGIKDNVQFQPAGIDLTLSKVMQFTDSGVVDFDNKNRKLSNVVELEFSDEGKIYLPKGAYKIVYNEIVKVPLNSIALGFPRSSLLRCGATIECAVWDSGYEGRSESLLLVENDHGITLYKDARILQLVFFETRGVVEKGYSGIYKGENI